MKNLVKGLGFRVSGLGFDEPPPLRRRVHAGWVATFKLETLNQHQCLAT